MGYADIIILALIAGFILLRLRSVLGQKTGFEGQPFAEIAKREPEAPVVRVNEATRAKTEAETQEETAISAIASPEARDAVAAIKAADAEFTVTHFLIGARAAFEMVFDAFVKGDRETLTLLLAPSVLEIFTKELDARSGQQTHHDTTLLAVHSQEIAGAEFAKSVARIRVHFVSEQVTVVRDTEGKIVEGNPSASHHAEDEWVFERDTTSKNPNWKIIET